MLVALRDSSPLYCGGATCNTLLEGGDLEMGIYGSVVGQRDEWYCYKTRLDGQLLRT
jgi:hypothetical protein